MSEWINVSEELPPVHKEVVLLVEGCRGAQFSNLSQIIGYRNIINDYITSPICELHKHQAILNDYGTVIAFKYLSPPPNFKE